MNQHEITERRPLLDASGNLTEPGYAKTLLPVYRQSPQCGERSNAAISQAVCRQAIVTRASR